MKITETRRMYNTPSQIEKRIKTHYRIFLYVINPKNVEKMNEYFVIVSIYVFRTYYYSFGDTKRNLSLS